MKAGDKIYIVRYGSWDVHYSVAEIVKVTPKGFVDVTWGNKDATGALQLMRFNPNGTEVAKSSFNNHALDLAMDFEERAADLARIERAKIANNLVRSLDTENKSGSGSKCYNKEDLTNWLNTVEARLLAQLAEARKAVEAI